MLLVSWFGCFKSNGNTPAVIAHGRGRGRLGLAAQQHGKDVSFQAASQCIAVMIGATNQLNMPRLIGP